jgi:hypothetical protein
MLIISDDISLSSHSSIHNKPFFDGKEEQTRVGIRFLCTFCCRQRGVASFDKINFEYNFT